MDKPVADAVCVALEAAGIGCWIAPRDIRAGSDWGEAIVGAINESRAMVLVFSAAANASKQVLREVERAVAKGVVVVPLRVDDQMPTGSYEYFLSATHWLDARSAPLERHLTLLIETVRTAIADPSSAQRHAGDLAQARDAAGRGDPQALHALALRQFTGDGVAADPEAALRSLTRAAEQGLAIAQHDLAAMHESRDDLGTAFRWYSRAARLGHAPAQERLAHWNDGVTRVEAEPEPGAAPPTANAAGAVAAADGMRWAWIAAVVGAVLVAGWLWRDALRPAAHGAAETAALAAQLDAGDATVFAELDARATRGDAQAAFALARAHDEGRGVARDAAQALAFYQRAAELGSVPAALVLGRAAQLGLGGAAVDLAAASRWYALAVPALTRAAEQGDAAAALRLAECYAQGLGVAKDAVAAARWRERGRL